MADAPWADPTHDVKTDILRAIEEQGDLLELLQEQETGPLPCPHIGAVRVATGGWGLQANPSRPYYGEWVHMDPRCMRSRFPGKNKQL